MVSIPILFSEIEGFSDLHTTMLFSLEAVVAIILVLRFNWMVRKVGLNRLFICAALLRALGALMLIEYAGLAISYLSMLILGGATFFHLIICQFWLNTIPISKFKGTFYSIFGAVAAGGIACGASLYTYLPELMFWDNTLSGPHLGIFSSGILCLIVLWGPVISPIRYTYKKCKVKMAAIISSNRGIYAAIVLCGISFFGVSWYMVLYGIRNGMDVGAASLLLSMFMIGGICLDPVLSLLGERFDRRYVLVLSCLVSCVLAIFLPVTIYYPIPSYILVFVWGGIVSSMYSCVLILLEEKLDASSQLTAHTAFFLMQNTGAFVGLVLIGTVLSLFGSGGFGYLIIAFNLAYFTYALYLFLAGKSKRQSMEAGGGQGGGA